MPFNGRIAIVDYRKCFPGKCSDGICVASQTCKRKVLIQEEPYEVPVSGALSCRACGDCMRACPMDAIQIIPA